MEPGVATARARTDEAPPEPIEHATPDVELAEAQLAVGRPQLPAEDVDGAAELELDSVEAVAAGIEPEAVQPEPQAHAAEAAATVPVPHVSTRDRLVGFLQGSWRELQRVQWPDRRQVIQATGVVIGFVIVAGVYLGVADAIAGKIVDLILK
jgi:preprotein translocase SecE subunit